MAKQEARTIGATYLFCGGFPELGVPPNKWTVYKGNAYENMDDLGVSPFQESSIFLRPMIQGYGSVNEIMVLS